MDRSQTGDHRGELSDAQLAWLDQRLRERPDTPTVLILRHPSLITGIGNKGW